MATDIVPYRKLVRDRIPELIRANGDHPITRVLERNDEYLLALHAKLAEESAELRAASPDDQLEELADILETLLALTSALGHTEEALAEAARTKRAARGAFARRVWLEAVSTPQKQALRERR